MTALALAAAEPLSSFGPGRPLAWVLVLAALSLVPFLILVGTAFVKISVVLSILRTAVGSPQLVPAQIITGLALLLTAFVMAPTVERAAGALGPSAGGAANASAAGLAGAGSLDGLGAAAEKAREPLRDFMLRFTAGREREAFFTLAQRMRSPEQRAQITDRDFLVVAPAFAATELKRAFEIGFLLLLPFLVIDLVIASVLGALGMSSLPPSAVSLPFKLLLFVLADGWHLVLHGLVAGYVWTMNMASTAGWLMGLAREGLILALLVSLPVLVVTMLVGLIVGVVQSATQVQDPALAFVPKVVAGILVLVAMGPALASHVLRFGHALLVAIAFVRWWMAALLSAWPATDVVPMLIPIGVALARAAPVAWALPAPTGAFKAAVAGGLALLALPAVASANLTLLPLPALSLLVLREVGVGAALALLVAACLRVAEVGGVVMDASLGHAPSPEDDGPATPLARLFAALALLLFLEVGGLPALGAALARSYESLPVLAAAGPAALSSTAGWPRLVALVIAATGGLFEAGLGLAAPVVVAVLLTEAVAAVLGRLVPGVVGAQVSVPARGLAGLLVLAAAFSTMALALVGGARNAAVLLARGVDLLR